MKRYEGLFILNTKEEGIKEIIDQVSNDITSVGGKIETVQKMDRRGFARVADKRFTSGFYVNVIFDAPAPAVAQLNQKFALNNDVFRVLFSEAAAVAEAAK
jgi:small subunit ribosomal protein S6